MILTLLFASAHALVTTPTVNAATLPTCTRLYLLPHNHPTANVCTLPKLRSMICIGTEMLNANAQLFNMFTPKNRSAIKARRSRGIEVGRRRHVDGESCVGRAKMDVRRNWLTVRSRP